MFCLFPVGNTSWELLHRAKRGVCCMTMSLLQVIKANDDLTPEHHQFFLYQMLRGLKYIHTGTTSSTSSLLSQHGLTPHSMPFQ